MRASMDATTGVWPRLRVRAWLCVLCQGLPAARAVRLPLAHGPPGAQMCCWTPGATQPPAQHPEQPNHHDHPHDGCSVAGADGVQLGVARLGVYHVRASHLTRAGASDDDSSASRTRARWRASGGTTVCWLLLLLVLALHGPPPHRHSPSAHLLLHERQHVGDLLLTQEVVIDERAWAPADRLHPGLGR
jgi:hypothetical protein